VDAAYGGVGAVDPGLRSMFEGWEFADSIIVNPHKWLFTPIDCSILFCRRPRDLERAFSLVPAYLSSDESGAVRNLMDYGVALGRRFRALKLWFVLRYFGREGIVARVRSHIAMASWFAESVQNTEGWEVVAPSPLALVAFRRVSADVAPEEADALNLRIMDRVNRTGRAFLTHTVLSQRVTLRLSIGNLKTTRAHVDEAWTLLQEAAAEG